MRVLTVDDLGFDQPGGTLFMAYLQSKERLAARSAGRHAERARPYGVAMSNRLRPDQPLPRG